MKKTLFLLILCAALLNHTAMAITALQLASRSTKAELDKLLQQAEKTSVSIQETARIRTLYVSLRQTQPKTATVIKDKVQKTEILAKLLPDIAGTQKIISTKTNAPLNPKEKQEIAKKVAIKTNTAIEKFKKGETDPVTVKEELTAAQNVTGSIDILTGSNISGNVEEKIEENKNIQIILDDEDIVIDPNKVAKNEVDLEKDLGVALLEPLAVDEPMVILEQIQQQLKVHTYTPEASERFDAYEKTAALILNYVDSKADEGQLISVRDEFITKLLEDIEAQCKKLKAKATFQIIGKKLFLYDRCIQLDKWIEEAENPDNIAELKDKIKQKKTWEDEYKSYTLPVVTNLQKLGDIFKTEKQVQLIFGDRLTQDQKRKLLLLFREYILGAWNPENLMLVQYNDHSIGGLLDRYLGYIQNVFVQKSNADRENLKSIVTNSDGIIFILMSAYASLFRQFNGIVETLDKTFFEQLIKRELQVGNSLK